MSCIAIFTILSSKSLFTSTWTHGGVRFIAAETISVLVAHFACCHVPSRTETIFLHFKIIIHSGNSCIRYSTDRTDRIVLVNSVPWEIYVQRNWIFPSDVNDGPLGATSWQNHCLWIKAVGPLFTFRVLWWRNQAVRGKYRSIQELMAVDSETWDGSFAFTQPINLLNTCSDLSLWKLYNHLLQ